jgi:hypothetical protein
MFAARRCLAALAVLLVASSAAEAGPVFDVAADFSATSNPTGPWSYGYSPTLGGPFVLFTEPGPFFGLDTWGDPGYLYLAAYHNGTPDPIVFLLGIRYEPGQFGLHPGPAGEYAVARFTAPAAGVVSVAAAFVGIDPGGPLSPLGTTTDVHVLHNGTAVFGDEVVGFGTTRGYSDTVFLAAGDTLDFAVGIGTNGTDFNDSTGVAATITYVDPAAVPEPASVGLLACGAVGLLGYARRRRAGRA